MNSRGLEICVSSTSFQKNDIDWPQQPLTKKMQKFNFSLFSDTLSVGGCWGQPMSFFWKLIDETQNLIPPEAARHPESIKLLILVPLRANLLCTLHYETPCSILKLNQNRKTPPMSSSTDKRKSCIDMKVGKTPMGFWERQWMQYYYCLQDWNIKI